VRLPILTLRRLISKNLQTTLTYGLPKNGQLGTHLLLPMTYGISNPNKTTHGTITSRSYQMRKDAPSSLPQSPPDHNAMQLPEKLGDQIEIITPSYPSLILWDMCQEWDLCTNNIIHPAWRTTLFMLLKRKRRHQLPLHLQRLVIATSAEARDTMHLYAR